MPSGKADQEVAASDVDAQEEREDRDHAEQPDARGDADVLGVPVPITRSLRESIRLSAHIHTIDSAAEKTQ